ncbi:hypothetical protein OAS39_11090 [Pirellulales bacterium]|nr:hypothetical protein [Pirellulales bacterium]
MPARKALPWSASDVHEELTTFGILPDHWYVLKARLSEDAFGFYVDRLHLRQWQAEDDSHNLNWNCSEKPWWNPTASNSDVWFRVGKDWALYAKHENGYVFVHSFER